MNLHLLKLGDFKFSVDTAAYRQLQQQSRYNWNVQERLNNTPALQYAGQGEQTITLAGVIYPVEYGSVATPDDLRAAAGNGKPLLMVSGTGSIMGYWAISSIENISSFFLPGGGPRKIEFNLKLSYYGEKYP